MRVTHVLALVALCATAMAIGSGFALRTTEHVPAATVEASPFASAPSTFGWSLLETPHASAANAAPTAWGAGARAGVDAMRDGYVRTPSFAELFERGLRNPATGGLFYARLAFRQCLMLGRGPTPDASSRVPDPLGPARARCGSLGDPVSRERLDATLATASARLDPALAIVDELDARSKNTQLTAADVRRAIDAAIALGDPYVLRNVLLRGVPRLETFDGQAIGAELRGDLMMASRLALCDLGIDCLREARVLLNCVRPEGCNDPLVAMGVTNTSLTDDRRRVLNDLSLRLGDATRDGSLARLFQ